MEESQLMIEPQQDEITFTFEHSEEIYEVYVDNKKVWRGSGKTYHLKNIEKEIPHNILIENVDRGISTSYFTETKSQDANQELTGNSKQLEEAFEKSTLTVKVFEDKIQLDIGFVPDE